MDSCLWELKSYIDEYLLERPSQSLRSLSIRSGIPYTTVWRVSQGQGQVDFGTAISLLSIVTPLDIAASFLERYFPTKSKIASHIFGNPDSQTPPANHQQKLNRLMPCLVFSHAATRMGSTKERIVKLYGLTGMAALSEMIEIGLLCEDSDGRIFPSRHCRQGNTPDAVIEDIVHNLSNFDPRQIEAIGTYLDSLTESVNEAALSTIKEILAGAFREIRAVIKDAASKGELPLFIGAAMGLLDIDPFIDIAT